MHYAARSADASTSYQNVLLYDQQNSLLQLVSSGKKMPEGPDLQGTATDTGGLM